MYVLFFECFYATCLTALSTGIITLRLGPNSGPVTQETTGAIDRPNKAESAETLRPIRNP